MSSSEKELILPMHGELLEQSSQIRSRFQLVARLAVKSTRLRARGYVPELEALLRRGTTGFEAVLNLDSLPRKVASTVVYVAMFTVSLALIQLSFSDYFSYKVNTSVDLKDYWQNGSSPPALTFCSVNGFKKSVFCSEENLHLTAKLCRIRYKTEFAAEYLKLANDTAAFEELSEIARAAALTIPETFKSCVLEGENCVEQIRESVVAPQRYGRCFCLFCKTPRKKWILSRGRTPESGLSLVLDSQREEILPSSASAGFLLLIHDYHILPDTNLDGVYLGFSRTSYIGIRRQEVQRLPSPFVSKCHDHWPEQFREFTQNHSYSKQLCIKLCTTLHLVRICRCSLSKRLRLEHFLDSDVFCQETPRTKKCSDKAAQRPVDCPCTARCKEYSYRWRVSHAGWRYSGEGDGQSVGGLTRLVVYYTKTDREEIKQEPRLKRAMFFNVLGGYFGMFVGYSFLILYEVMEIHLRWLISRFAKH